MDGAEIKRLREARGLTQEQLAEALKVNKQTISNWETGATAPKNREGMIRRYFGIDGDGSSNPLSDFSDATLLSELLRRTLGRTSDTGR